LSKHLLYLTNTQLTATLWDGSTLLPSVTFDNYASGWAKFVEYLDAHAETPTFLITDLIEEDFQRESIPHVFGKAKKALIDRRLNNLYRDTRYRSAVQQGREKDGRRDDKMLFSALTNEPLIKPWTDALESKNIHLTGVYSVALLSGLIYKKLKLSNEPTLLVTHQSSGLRQSFFRDGYLRFSRLSPETAWSPESIAEMTDVEMAKTRQFLVSTRLIDRDTKINIVVIADKDILEFLLPLSTDNESRKYQLIHLHEAKVLLGLRQLSELNLCDPLFLTLLASNRVPAHYATAEQQRLYFLNQTKVGLNLVSILTIAAAIFITADAGISAYQAISLTKQAKFETKSALAKYQATVSSMPVTVVNPHDMKVVVELHKMLSENSPVPDEKLAVLSAALDALPQIKIHEIKWEASENAPAIADPNQAAPVQGENIPINPVLLGIGGKSSETMTIEAEIVPFKNDYRTAIEIVDELIKNLKKDARLQIELVTPPLDIRTSVKLESLSGKDEDLAKPKFTLKLVWRT
jgi:hypothetical protein